MPSYLIGVKKDQVVFVAVNDANLYYGFSTKTFDDIPGVTAAEMISLGHLPPTSVPGGAYKVIGAKSPKPPRVRRIINDDPSATQQGSISTFCAYNKIGDAQAIGWKLAKIGRGVKFTNNDRTVTASAKLSNGMFYSFPLNKAEATKYASILGLQLPESMTVAERKRAVTGATLPRAGRMILPTTGTSGKKGGFSTFVSFDAVDNASSAGWEEDSQEALYV